MAKRSKHNTKKESQINEQISKEVEDEEEEEYPSYDMTGNTINVTINDGGLCVFQSGHPIPWPPKT